MRRLREIPRTWKSQTLQQGSSAAVPSEEGGQLKRSWTVIVGAKRFTLILMEDCDPLAVVKSIWPEGRVER